MTRRTATELIREGQYVAEVTVELEYGEENWSPTMSLDDAQKLERVAFALRGGNITEAARDAKVLSCCP